MSALNFIAYLIQRKCQVWTLLSISSMVTIHAAIDQYGGTKDYLWNVKNIWRCLVKLKVNGDIKALYNQKNHRMTRNLNYCYQPNSHRHVTKLEHFGKHMPYKSSCDCFHWVKMKMMKTRSPQNGEKRLFYLLKIAPKMLSDKDFVDIWNSKMYRGTCIYSI